jgi:hypothetical protein
MFTHSKIRSESLTSQTDGKRKLDRSLLPFTLFATPLLFCILLGGCVNRVDGNQNNYFGVPADTSDKLTGALSGLLSL